MAGVHHLRTGPRYSCNGHTCCYAHCRDRTPTRDGLSLKETAKQSKIPK